MPILQALIDHVGSARTPLHVPGHRQGRGLPSPLLNWLGAAAKLDLTELPGLDNLHTPTGCIAASQALTAAYYGAAACFYSVNGSTAGVMAALLACVREGDLVLMANPFHISAWRGLVFAGATPICLTPSFMAAAATVGPVDVRQVEAALSSHSFAAVYVTSPTYQGVVSPMRELAEVAHRHGVPLIVDEAHGAHFGLIPAFPEHSVSAGADIVIHSAHKMLPSLTQTAWVLCQGSLVDPERVAHSISTMQTTSPSYLLLASLDATQAWLRFDGPRDAARALAALAPLHADACMDQRDPMRHFVPTYSARESARLERRLAAAGIYVEYADALGLLAVFGMSITTREVACYERIVSQWRKEMDVTAIADGQQTLPHMEPIQLECSPRAAEQSKLDFVQLADSEGRIAGRAVTPYPPGVPVVLPGQRITKNIVRSIQSVHCGEGHVLGIEAGGTICVLAE